MVTEELIKKLNEYHKEQNITLLYHKSPIMGRFEGEFNVSGYHNEILELKNKPWTFWGVDECLRIQEHVDSFHSYLFNMSIFATALNLEEDFRDPFTDPRFHNFQEEILTSFLDLIMYLGINTRDLEATYLDQLNFGKSETGRGSLLVKSYTFPRDELSKEILEQSNIKSYPVKSIANLDIHPVESSLVGPRIEIAYRDMEIGTVVFDCFQINNGKLSPMNYIGGYAVGVERLVCAINESNLLEVIPNYKHIFETIREEHPYIESPFFEDKVFTVVYGLGVIERANKLKNLSRHQKTLLKKFKQKFRDARSTIGINDSLIKSLIGEDSAFSS